MSAVAPIYDVSPAQPALELAPATQLSVAELQAREDGLAIPIAAASARQ